jgi:hypothetical protein
MSTILFHFWHFGYVIFVMCIAYFLFLCHMSTSGFEVLYTVTYSLKGHVLVILSEGVMAYLKQNIDITKLKQSYKWSGVWQEKGLSSKSVLGCDKEDGCVLVQQ